DETISTEPAEEVVATHAHQGRFGTTAADHASVGKLDAHVEPGHDAMEQGACDRGVHGPVPGSRTEALPRTTRQLFGDVRRLGAHATPSCTERRLGIPRARWSDASGLSCKRETSLMRHRR